MTGPTLVSRVARFQTAVGFVALMLVFAGTMGVVDRLLVWKTDHHLASVMDRVAKYLDSTELESVDFRWLAGEVEEIRPPELRVEIADPLGQRRVAAGPGQAPLGPADGCVSQGAVRGCALAHGGFVVRAARDRRDDRDVEWQVASALLGACALVGLGIALSARVVTRRAIQPLFELSERVEAVEPGTGERVGFRSDLAELDALGHRFDDLIQRFDAALAREKRFSAEASHELRTPLTVARAELEELMSSSDRDRPTLGRAISSIDRLSALVEALLWFARAQGKLEAERFEVVNIADLVRLEMAIVEPSHPLGAIDDIPDEALVQGDEELLRRAVANLLENAAKHGDRTPIRVALTRAEGRLRLSVANGGRPIPAKLKEDIFEPFFRCRGQAQGAPGFGLGLPFARAVARSHGGELAHGPDRDQEVEMVLTLPLVDWNA